MTGFNFSCSYCGRPIGGDAVYIGMRPYHYECTRGPGAPLEYAPMPADRPAQAKPAATLTESDVRRIVREELAAWRRETT